MVEKSSGKRKYEKLTKCETDADKLLKAAKLRGDQRILLQIGKCDPVSIEVCYHASCYKQFTKCLYEQERDYDKTPFLRPLQRSFDQFCAEVIDKRLICNGEILKIDTLRKIFIRTVEDTENIDINTYRNFQLKAKLQGKYPDLEFVQLGSKRCEVVFYNISTDKCIINIAGVESDTDTEDSDGESGYYALKLVAGDPKQEKFALLYRSALIIRDVIAACPGMDTWPPCAGDFSLEECNRIIPTELYNFISWCCNVSEEFSTTRVITEDNKQQRVLSIAQDMVNFGSNGRKLLPKHVSLGLTVRHLTGTTYLNF